MAILLLFIVLFLIRPATQSYRTERQRKKAIQARQAAQQAAAAYKLQQAEEKRLEKIRKEKERLKARQEKTRQQAAQAAQDIPFYDIQLERLYITAEDTRNQYRKTVEIVNHDNELNRFGAVTTDKVIKQHITDRDHALKKLITIENQIHALEKKRAAAERILNIN